jgi:DNA primase
MEAVLEAARPLSEALFGLLCDAVGDATPELRASLSKRLDEAAGQIADRALAWEYRREFRDRLAERNRARRPAYKGGGRKGGGGFADNRRDDPWPRTALPRPPLSAETGAMGQGEILVAILLSRPEFLTELDDSFGRVALPPSLANLRSAMLEWSDSAERVDSDALMNHLTKLGLAGEAARVFSQRPSCAASDAMPDEVVKGWWHFYGLMHRETIDNEIEIAKLDFNKDPAGTQRKLIGLIEAKESILNDLRS